MAGNLDSKLSLVVLLVICMTARCLGGEATGIVFHDLNGNRQPDDGEPTMKGIRVSNGKDIVTTDERGRYALPVGDDTSIFVIKPTGFRTVVDENRLPQFYYTHKPHGSPSTRFPGVEPTGDLPASIDFPLYQQAEPNRFTTILFGDPQPRDMREVEYIAHDVVEELVGSDASFGVTLGDITFDNLDLFLPQAKVISAIGIPWYNVIGNHDLNTDAKSDKLSDESFERCFGPNYYSFDYGPVHFLVLDDVEWFVPEGKVNGTYRGGIDDDQLEFIANDLKSIPDNQLVVLMMHIPLNNIGNRGELFRLIERRPYCISISAHTHTNEHRLMTSRHGWQGAQPHHHIVNVTVSGSWWSGAPDERRIPHATMSDGAPNGYSILAFDGNHYDLTYKAAARPADYQMAIYLPEQVGRDQLSQTKATVNVFNGSSRSSVQFRLDDRPWQPMSKVVKADPQFKRVSALENAIAEQLSNGDDSVPWRPLPKPSLSSHLWESTLPADLSIGTHQFDVWTTDMHGKSYLDQRLFRVVAQADAAKPPSTLSDDASLGDAAGSTTSGAAQRSK